MHGFSPLEFKTTKQKTTAYTGGTHLAQYNCAFLNFQIRLFSVHVCQDTHVEVR